MLQPTANNNFGEESKPLNGILVVSFGSTYEETAKKNIQSVEEALKKIYPHAIHGAAYTSHMVRQRLEKRGIHKDSLEEAFQKMLDTGVSHLRIQPTHLLYGIEYEKIQGFAQEWGDKFQEIILCQPLFGSEESMVALGQILGKTYPPEDGKALLCVGHGTAHHCNSLYLAFEYLAKEQGYSHLYVCTLEAYPSLERVIPLLQKDGIHHVTVIPLMLVAGDHVQEDIISEEPDSVCSILKKAGFDVSYETKGLGEYPDVPLLYGNICEQGAKT